MYYTFLGNINILDLRLVVLLRGAAIITNPELVPMSVFRLSHCFVKLALGRLQHDQCTFYVFILYCN